MVPSTVMMNLRLRKVSHLILKNVQCKNITYTSEYEGTALSKVITRLWKSQTILQKKYKLIKDGQDIKLHLLLKIT